MKTGLTVCFALVLSAWQSMAQTIQLPRTVSAGAAFSASTGGSGKADLYIVGLGQVLKRPVQLGETVAFSNGELRNAGHYTAFLVGPGSTQTAEFDITPATQPDSLSFLAKPSRVPVKVPDGISGVVYLFDAFRNLILAPMPVSFQLAEADEAAQQRSVETRNGVAWVTMNSAAKAGNAQFLASVGGIVEKRVVQQVPGDPCSLRMTGHPSGDQIDLETEPLRDCSGNPVPDGTIVTFTENYHGTEATVDAPIKRGIARTQMPAHNGAIVTVASGVVLGNEIRWQGGK